MAWNSAREVAAELTSSRGAAWNQHGMPAFAGLFHDDAAFVNVAGAYLHGRDEIERTHAAVHAGPFCNSTLTVWPEDARSVGSEVIRAHVRSELHGDDRPWPGPPGDHDAGHRAARLALEDRHGAQHQRPGHARIAMPQPAAMSEHGTPRDQAGAQHRLTARG